MPAPAQSTIDKTTKVTAGILIWLIGATAGAVMYLEALRNDFSDLNSEMTGMRKQMVSLEQAVNRNTSQSVLDGKVLAVLQTIVQGLESRITKLEDRIREMENRK